MTYLAKEAGYILSIDEASNAAGITLWHNGELIDLTTINSRSKSDPLGKRLAHIVADLEAWLTERNVSDIRTVIFEGVKARLVIITVGAFCTVQQLRNCRVNGTSFIGSMQWKKYARDRGATGPFTEIKGIKALKEIGQYDDRITTDDEADSKLLYLTWRDYVPKAKGKKL